MTAGTPKMECATGIPRRSLLLSSMSSINNDALWRSPMISYEKTPKTTVRRYNQIKKVASSSFLRQQRNYTLIESKTSGDDTFNQSWKQSTIIPRTSFPGTELMYRNGSRRAGSGEWGNVGCRDDEPLSCSTIVDFDLERFDGLRVFVLWVIDDGWWLMTPR